MFLSSFMKKIFGCPKLTPPKFIIHPEVTDFISRKSKGASGFDLPAFHIEKSSTGQLSFPITLKENARVLIDTGLKWEAGYNENSMFELQIRPRSGFSTKGGVIVTNSPGTVDADYRGKIMVHLTKIGEGEVTIEQFDRIAQAVITKVFVKPIFKIGSTISDSTERGEGGFGHTGK